MACDLTTIQNEACSSGIGRVRDKITLLQLIAQLTCEAAEGGGGGGGGVWGAITGDIEDQADLQAEFSGLQTQIDNRIQGWVGVINADSSHTGDTAETQLGTITIPAGTLGPNGFFRTTIYSSQTSSANNKQVKIRAGSLVGTEISSYNVNSQLASIFQSGFYNRQNPASNLVGPVGSPLVFGGGGTPLSIIAVDTTVDLTLVFSITLANSGETFTLRQATVQAFYLP